MPRFLHARARRGFTLIELLVVIGIMGVLVALVLAAVQRAREAANRVSCQNNLRQLALAAQNFHGVHQKFPTGARLPVYVGGVPTGATNLWVELLPYFEQDNLHGRWDYDDNGNNAIGGRSATQAQVIQTLLCPSDPLPETVVEVTGGVAPHWSWGFYGMSSYGGNAGKRSVPFGAPPDFPGISRDGVFWIDSSVRCGDIKDGTSNTLLFGERFHRDPEFDGRQPVVAPGTAPIAQAGRWATVAGPGAMPAVTLHAAVPINYQMPTGGDFSALSDRVCAFGSGHVRGANFAFADGSLRFVSDSIALRTLQALSTRAGEEVVSADDY
jgi:prepilin-type N-terminal cleavage/methylation domain-containing protein/prepilin-type processing-associated H-X9-DG protein